MPMDRSRYPDDWEDVRAAVLERAGDRCECAGECGRAHPERCGRCSEQYMVWLSMQEDASQEEHR